MDEYLFDEDLLNEFDGDSGNWEAQCLNASADNTKIQDLIEQSRNPDEAEPAPKSEHLKVLLRCFGHKSFRPLQWRIINSIMNDKRDNLAIMATGYGKSLCFQYPSVYCGGVTLVISPLISLMEDQVLALKIANIPACLLGSAQAQQNKVMADILENKYSLVYLTPEFCLGESGRDFLLKMVEQLSLTLIAIDEAHCVSFWGHDFRQKYRQLGNLRKMFPAVPILAVTATATTRVRADIVTSLKLKDPQVLCSGFDRPNLFFKVNLRDGTGSTGVYVALRTLMVKEDDVYTFPGSSIIYTITRKQTEEIAEVLSLRGVKCAAYHAGMSVKKRKEVHEDFVRDKLRAVVATIAFGMGIDKPDVRFVIHYGVSKDMESYYQEVGRAGRDGQPSKCVMFYTMQDFDLLEKIENMGPYGANNNKQQLRDEMKRYIGIRTCRRDFILNYFEGDNRKRANSVAPYDCCDNCQRLCVGGKSDAETYEKLDESGRYDFTRDAQLFLEAVVLIGARGFKHFVDFLRGSSTTFEKYKKHENFGAGKLQSKDWWTGVGRLLEVEDYLCKTMKKIQTKGNYTPQFATYTISKKGEEFLRNVERAPERTKLLLTPNPELLKQLKRKNPTPSPSTITKFPSTSNARPLKLLQKDAALNEMQMRLYRLLTNKRSELSSRLDCMPYMIANNEILMKMARLAPRTLQQLRESELGFTEAKIVKFGPDFIELIKQNTRDHPSTSTATSPKSIEDILQEHPMPDAKSVGHSAEITLAMHKSGSTIPQIARNRNFAESTIVSHLATFMSLGFPIKLADFGVTPAIASHVRTVYRNLTASADCAENGPSLTDIKNLCAPEITYEQLRAVVTYVRIRDHLDALGVQYEDFEEPIPDTIKNEAEAAEVKDCLSVLLELAAADGGFEDEGESARKKPRVEGFVLVESPKRDDFDESADSDKTLSFDWSSLEKNGNKNENVQLVNESPKKKLPEWVM